MARAESETASPGRCAGTCRECGLDLPLRGAAAGESPRSWHCARCGTQHSAVLDDGRTLAELAHVRPACFPFDARLAAQPPRAIAEYIQRRFAGEGQLVRERRGVRRYRVTATVAAIPVNAHLDPAGQPWMLVTRDISTRGIALVSTRPAPGKLLVVDLSNAQTPGIQVVVRVVRCRSEGRFYEIAGTFVTRMATRARSVAR